MSDYIDKCKCYIHSLKQDENHVLGEATILKGWAITTIWPTITV